MDILLFTAVAACLYFFSDWLLRALERWNGAMFKNRSILFFIIILVLSLVVFELMQQFLVDQSGG